MDLAVNQDFSKNLNRVHKIISRALDVSIDNLEKFAGSGFSDKDLETGFFNYVSSLLTVIDVHHRLEDEIAFPYLQGKFPLAPFDELEDQHSKIVIKLKEANTCLSVLRENFSKEEISKLKQSLNGIKLVWHPHIALEESQFDSKDIMERIGQEEQNRLVAEFADFSKTHATPDYLIIPFLLFNLQDEDREVFSTHFPPVVVNELAPNVWKAKWISMKPFLLN